MDAKSEEKNSTKPKTPGKCPKCTFAGSNSNTEKFDAKIISKFPKGFAPENHVKSKVIKKSGQEIAVVITDGKGNPEYFQVNRCPVCGHKELAQ